jgi:uncharacterized protein (DUF58 family)
MIEAILERVCYIPYCCRGMSRQQRLGRGKSRVRGSGLEFDRIRDYEPGEGICRINWTATARQGNHSLLVNTYYEEKALTVMLAVDLSASMDFGTKRLSKKALAAELGASLVYSALRSNDRVGLLGFTSDVAVYIPPGQARHYQWLIPHAILQYDSTQASTDYRAMVATLQQCLKQRALVFLVSDFLTADTEQLAQTVEALRDKHDLVSVTVSDPRETELPVGIGRMVTRDLETGKIAAYHFSRRSRRRMARAARARQEQWQELWERLDIAHVTVTPESNYPEDLTQMFLMHRGRMQR